MSFWLTRNIDRSSYEPGDVLFKDPSTKTTRSVAVHKGNHYHCLGEVLLICVLGSRNRVAVRQFFHGQLYTASILTHAYDIQKSQRALMYLYADICVYICVHAHVYEGMSSIAMHICVIMFHVQIFAYVFAVLRFQDSLPVRCDQHLPDATSPDEGSGMQLQGRKAPTPREYV